MKTITRLSAILLLIFFTNNKVAAQVELGLQAGIALPKFSPGKYVANGYYNSMSTSYYIGYNFGVVSNIKLSKKLSLQPAVLISSDGTRMDAVFSYFDTSSRRMQLIYLKIPVNMVYKWAINKKHYAFAGGGLYVARGLWGAEVGHGNTSDISYSLADRIIFRNNDPGETIPTNLKPYDFGFNILAGIQINEFEIVAGYSRGITDVFSNSELYNAKYKNAVFNLSARYYIHYLPVWSKNTKSK